MSENVPDISDNIQGGCSILYRLQIAPTSLLRHFLTLWLNFFEEFTKCSNLNIYHIIYF